MYLYKFDSQATESLYNQTADDELGQSLDGRSWYRLYRAQGASGGSIVIEDTLGFVGRADFETDLALTLAWMELETEDSVFHGSEWDGFGSVAI